MEQTDTTYPLLNNRYKLLKTLGAGGMAVVYQAQDITLERMVAIKLLRQDYSRREDFRQQFRLEAKNAANLSHQNIVTVHDFGFDAGRLFIVMEFVPGTDLKTLIKQRGRFQVSDAVNLISQACAGIGYAHRAGIVHCDIKPHNMLVTPDQRLKVTDFGIARILSTISQDEHSDEVWGSPQYFSPEQAEGKPPSPASDVYSLGVVLYEMLTGQLPFNSTDPQELARMHRESRPVPPRRLNHDIPPALDQIIMKVLSKEPSQRYRTADQLGLVLAPFNGRSERIAPIAQNTASGTAVTQAYAAQPAQPATDSTRPGPAAFRPVFQPEEIDPPRPGSGLINLDLATVGLILTAIAMVAGLIPFWIYVIMTILH